MVLVYQTHQMVPASVAENPHNLPVRTLDGAQDRQHFQVPGMAQLGGPEDLVRACHAGATISFSERVAISDFVVFESLASDAL
jgi:hypothetical protein